MRITQDAVNLVKEFEGLRLDAYRDPVGVVTIGYGYTNRAGFGPGVSMGDTWTEAQAEHWLKVGLENFAHEIRPLLKRDATPNQFGAFVSLAYNIGTGAFSRSTCLKRFNAGDIQGAAEALTWFNKAGGQVLRGLVRRREAERDLFFKDTPNGLDFVVTEQPDPEKRPQDSTTLMATTVALVSSAGQVLSVVKGVVSDITESFGISPEVALFIITAGALGWVFRERIKKLARGI